MNQFFAQGYTRNKWEQDSSQSGQPGFPGSSVVKNLPVNAGDSGLIPGLGRSPGEGNGNPLQYFCLGNPMDRGAWQSAVHGVSKSRTRLSDFESECIYISATFSICPSCVHRSTPYICISIGSSALFS